MILKQPLSILLIATVFLVVPMNGSQQVQDPPPSQSSRIGRALREMSDFLTSATSFGFTIHELADEVEDGLRIQYSNRRSIVVRRPDRIAGEAAGDLLNRAFWYDGKSFSLLDREHNSYFRTQAPGTIDALLDDLAKRFEVVLPLAELLSEDIYSTLTRHVDDARYMGLHQVRGVGCHHLVFTQEPGIPQYTAVMSAWDFTIDAPDELFQFTPPEGARKIDLSLAQKTLEK